MRNWFSGGLTAATLKLKEASPLCESVAMVAITAMKKAMFAALTCILAIGGALVGIIIGAIKGQTTETGFLRGAGIGAITGAITAVQLLDLMLNGESLSKVALLCSLMEGKVFIEWVGPAMLKAYQWQVNNIETAYREISDIFDTADEGRGLSHNCIQRIPMSSFRRNSLIADRVCCSICLQDFEEGESTRNLPRCKHVFHANCLDQWLTRKASCPICRDQIWMSLNKTVETE